MRSVHPQHPNTPSKRLPYEVPAIIYEGLISTRAGSALPGSSTSGASSQAVDPADLFNN